MRNYSSITRRGLHRSRNGIIFGVCRGVADYFDFSVFWVRAMAVAFFIFTGFWPAVGLYILAALLMKSEPEIYAGTRPKSESCGRYSYASHDAADRLKRKWQQLEGRIRRMERREHQMW